MFCIGYFRVADPHSFHSDPDPEFRLNTDPDPIRIRIQSGSGSNPDPGLSWPKIGKKLQLKKKKIFGSKTIIYPSLGLHKERPGYRTEEAFSSQKRPSNTSKPELLKFFTTFVGHFCPPGSGSRFRIRIHWPDWIRIQSGSRSATLGYLLGRMSHLGFFFELKTSLL